MKNNDSDQDDDDDILPPKRSWQILFEFFTNGTSILIFSLTSNKRLSVRRVWSKKIWKSPISQVRLVRNSNLILTITNQSDLIIEKQTIENASYGRFLTARQHMLTGVRFYEGIFIVKVACLSGKNVHVRRWEGSVLGGCILLRMHITSIPSMGIVPLGRCLVSRGVR